MWAFPFQALCVVAEFAKSDVLYRHKNVITLLDKHEQREREGTGILSSSSATRRKQPATSGLFVVLRMSTSCLVW